MHLKDTGLTRAHCALRGDTLAHHKQVEKAPLLRKLMADNLSLLDYSLILCRWRQWFLANESHICSMLEDFIPQDMKARLKLPLINKDLNQELLLAFKSDWQARSTTVSRLALSDKYETLGALYVVEGSTLGSQIIVKRLKARLTPNLSHFYYNGYSDHNRNMWLEFVAQLNSKLSDADAIERAVAGAKKAFSSLENTFQY